MKPYRVSGWVDWALIVAAILALWVMLALGLQRAHGQEVLPDLPAQQRAAPPAGAAAPWWLNPESVGALVLGILVAYGKWREGKKDQALAVAAKTVGTFVTSYHDLRGKLAMKFGPEAADLIVATLRQNNEAAGLQPLLKDVVANTNTPEADAAAEVRDAFQRATRRMLKTALAAPTVKLTESTPLQGTPTQPPPS